MNQPSDLRERNLRGIFAVFDVDGDGVISESDFVEMARIVCELIEVTDDTKRTVGAIRRRTTTRPPALCSRP